MSQRVNLRYLAELTGFSIKTVSRALNGHPDVNEGTRSTILDTARDHGYRPNLVAKSLRMAQTFTVGYIVPDITNEFFGRIGAAVERIFRDKGYSLLVSFTEGSHESEIDSLKLLLSHRVCGIILATLGTTGDFLLNEVQQDRVPIVAIDNKEQSVRLNSVLHDNIRGAYKLTRHLIDHGHFRIACITGPASETSARERLEGYRRALVDSGTEPTSAYERFANWHIDGGASATKDILDGSAPPPTGIVVGNTVMAIGVLKALSERRVSVPEQVAIVSFDNMSFAEVVDPPLTTLESTEDRIAELAANLLWDRMQDHSSSIAQELYVDAGLCIRQSCGCRRKATGSRQAIPDSEGSTET